MTGWTLRRADLVTGDSADLLAAVAAYRPRGRLELVHWGVDLGRFRPADWAHKPGFQIVSLRSWEPNYRIDTVVSAFGQLAGKAPDAHLHLLGGGSLEAALREQVAALGLTSRVSLHGRLGDAAMSALLDVCKVSVSVPESDATSVSVLESMAAGLAVVASDLPANRHWLADADAGLLVSAGGRRCTGRGARGAVPPTTPDAEPSASAITAACCTRARAPRRWTACRRSTTGLRADEAPQRDRSLPQRGALHRRLLRQRAAPAAAARMGIAARHRRRCERRRHGGATRGADNGRSQDRDGRQPGTDRLRRPQPGARPGDRRRDRAARRPHGTMPTITSPPASPRWPPAARTTWAARGAPSPMRGPGPRSGRLLRPSSRAGWPAARVRATWGTAAGSTPSTSVAGRARPSTASAASTKRSSATRTTSTNLRLARGGGKVWQAAAIRSCYRPRARLGQVFRQYLQYGYWKPFVMKKHGQAASVRHLIPGAFVAALAAAAALALVGGPRWPVAGLGVVYGYAVVAMTALVVGPSRLDAAAAVRVPLAIGAYHVGYGLGSLLGAWDVARGAAGGARFASLTR